MSESNTKDRYNPEEGNEDEQEKPDPDDVPMASTEGYTDETQDEKEIVLQDAYMKLRVEHLPPFQIVAKLREYGLMDVVAGEQDPSEMSDDDDKKTVKEFEAFLRNEVKPRVVEPEVVYDEPDADGTRTFDLSELTAQDGITLILGMMGMDPNEVQDITEDEGEQSFRG